MNGIVLRFMLYHMDVSAHVPSFTSHFTDGIQYIVLCTVCFVFRGVLESTLLFMKLYTYDRFWTSRAFSLCDLYQIFC
jgi:hypothetical protein